MPDNPSTAIPAKPRVLIADDSRIVRAMLIKHIEGMFDFREAFDGEQAWETLLIDPTVRVVISDLTMPKLDGYGLLQRIRNSKISRIRNIPVVMVSGSDEQELRDRIMAAGANDIVTKGIDTAQLLSRLDVLTKLVNTQQEFARGLEVLVHEAESEIQLPLSSIATLETHATILLDSAVQQGRNFVVLNVCIGLKHASLEGAATSPPASVVNAIGQLLQRTVRQTDIVTLTGDAEFTLVTGSIQFDAARNFAQRICGAIASANMIKDENITFIASCGMASLSEYDADTTSFSLGLNALREVAHKRALLGLERAVSGVVGAEEQLHFEQGTALPNAAQNTDQSVSGTNPGASDAPPLATFLQWIKEGKRDLVQENIGKLSAELQPMIEFMLQQMER